MSRKIVLLLLAIGYWQLVYAESVIDEVIWVVGDEAILRSEVEEERLRAQYEGQQIHGDPYCVIPEQIAVQKLFLHQAVLDSVEANESSVSHQVDMRLNYYINQIGSKEKMEEYFRKPSSEIREEMMTTVRNQMIIQQMQAKLTADIKPTPADIRRYYNSLPMDSIPMMPAQVEVQILSFEPPVPVEETERKLRRSITERPRQVAKVLKGIDSAPVHSIVAGDFNDTPLSYTYFRLIRGRRDSFMRAGKGFGATYSALWPLLRLDYILYPKDLQAVSYRIEKVNFSDHYPVIVQFNEAGRNSR